MGSPRVFWLFSAGFATGALFHCAALLNPGLGEFSPPWRHLLFVSINLIAAIGMVWRPRGFVIAFAVLCAQQLYSHGTALFSIWHVEHRVDWASVVVLTVMPLGLALLVRDARAIRPRRIS